MIQSKYPQYLKPFLWLKSLLNKILCGVGKCQGLHLKTKGTADRVLAINAAASGCCCEKVTMSEYSPGPVADVEEISRFVFSPMFVGKKGVKNNVFGHVLNRGCSIQREDLASDNEIQAFKDNFIANVPGQSWHGTLVANCGSLRSITLPGRDAQSVCVYDTSEQNNPAHGEFCQSQSYKLSEDDVVELRYKLSKAFDVSNPIPPANYRNGRIK